MTRKLCLIVAVSVFIYTPAFTQNSSFQNGLKAYQQGEYKSALPAFQKATRADPSHAEAFYYLGLTEIHIGQYENAALALETARELNPALSAINLNLGIAYYKMGVYEVALLELYKARDARPNDATTWFFLGLTYQAKGDQSKAAAAFETAARLDPNSDTAAYARNMLDKDISGLIVEKGENKPWTFKAFVGLEYDDNLTVVEQDIVSNVDDSALILEVDATYRLMKGEGYNAEASYNFYQSIHEDVSTFDLQSHTGNLLVEKEVSEIDLSLNYAYSYLQLDNKDFLGVHSIAPGIGYLMRPDTYGTFNYSYMNKDFMQSSNDGRDADNQAIGPDVYYFFHENKAYAMLGYRAVFENAADSQFDYDAQKWYANLKYPLYWKTTAALSYRYEIRDYNLNPAIAADREDNIHIFDIRLSRPITDDLELSLEYEYTNSDSNLESSHYDGSIVLFGITYSH